MNLLSSCFRPFGRHSEDRVDSVNGNGFGGKEGLLWFRDLGKYGSGDFSMAVVQANQVLEDQSQIESGPFGTFVGVYDGHGGPDAARYVCDHLFPHFQAIAAETQGVVTRETIERAFRLTEEGFTAQVSELWSTRPQIATVGSCCLVGMISRQTLFVANLGDSRVVLGKKVGNTGGTAAIQLSKEHNANFEEIRQELKELHPHDPQIVILKHGVWRVKGIIQVSRSIGDLYMKNAQYNREPINGKFRLPEPMNMPILTANPSIIVHPLHPNDSFLIFASDGLWEHLSNEKAVDIVQNHPRVVRSNGIAKRLVKAALQEAARKREMRYADLQKIDKMVRRHFHDDITVIVLFLNHDLISRGTVQDPPLSIRCALQH
ncbi:putative protein phosphatase 2C 42 [Citrus sinensis]|uniref:Uncharacterized protein n=1 Tax=Citrus sinensis TaxID=2711 RepID=A0ACB8IA74_CITSI|nr:putative protein phosphatase 2C 42 [Citrus sinensis]